MKKLKKQKKQEKISQKAHKNKNKDKKIAPEVLKESQQDQNDINDNPFNFNNRLEDEEIIQVSFLIAQLNENHYHSLKTVLQRYSSLVSMNSSDIASTILQNKSIGNVSVCDNDQNDEDEQNQQQQQQDKNDEDQDNVYSIITILASESKVGQKVKNLFGKSIQKSGKNNKELKEAIRKSNVLINERLTNLPAFVAQNSHAVMVKDLNDLRKSDKNKFKQTVGSHLIAVSEVEIQNSEDLDSLIFPKFEDYEFAKCSQVWWLGEKVPKKGIKADFRRFYYLISVDQYLDSASKLEKYIE